MLISSCSRFYYCTFTWIFRTKSNNNFAYHRRIFYLWPHFMIIKFNEYSIQMHWTADANNGTKWMRTESYVFYFVGLYIDMEFRGRTKQSIVSVTQIKNRAFTNNNNNMRLDALTHSRILSIVRLFLFNAFNKSWHGHCEQLCVVVGFFSVLFSFSLLLVYNTVIVCNAFGRSFARQFLIRFFT